MLFKYLDEKRTISKKIRFAFCIFLIRNYNSIMNNIRPYIKVYDYYTNTLVYGTVLLDDTNMQ